MRIIVCGLIAQYPLGGVAWDYLQYVTGLRNLGHEVYYIEDTGQWPFNPKEAGTGKGCEFNVEYLHRLMAEEGLDNRWAYRFPWQEQWFGIDEDSRREVIETADLLINVSGCLRDPSEYRSVRRLCYIDSDPIFTQLKILRGQADLIGAIGKHDVRFSFGEAVANRSSTLHDRKFDWLPTRQPIVLKEWTQQPEAHPFTTIMNWTSYKDIHFDGKIYGQKDKEFERFMILPRQLPEMQFEIALNEGKTRRTPKARLTHEGWTISDPNEVCPDKDSYRDFIASSRGEWSVAKSGYVTGNSGWFSCRSACYLAAGRPVVVQSTGFEEFIPTGMGVLSFSDMDGAVCALREVEADYEGHARAARAIAESHFDSERVLTELLERAL